MSHTLRIELIVLAILFFCIVVRNVNKRNLQMKYSLIWILASALLVAVAIAPKMVYKAAACIGIETPSNFIFLICLAWMIGMNLMLSIIVSRQSEKIKKIIQVVSLDNYERERESREKIERADQQRALL